MVRLRGIFARMVGLHNPNFNSDMVRLRVMKEVKEFITLYDFNSDMVRLRDEKPVFNM